MKLTRFGIRLHSNPNAQDERRHEVQMRRKLELNEILNNASLLKDMLDACEQNGASSQPTEDEVTTMKFLYDACKKLHPTILIILSDVSETECLTNAVDANEFVSDVFQKYRRVIVQRQPSSDLITPVATTTNGQSRASTMDELSEIFASGGSQTNHANHTVNMMPLAPTPATPPIESNGKGFVVDRIVVEHALMKSTKNSLFPIKGFTDKLLDTLLAAEPIDKNHAANSSPFDSIAQAVNLEAASTSKPSLIPSSAMLATSESKSNAIKTKFENFDTQLNELITGLKSNLAKEADSPLDDDKLLLLSDPECCDKIEIPSEPSHVGSIEVEPCVDQVIDADIKSVADKAIVESATYSSNSQRPNRLTDIVIDFNAIEPHEVHSPNCILDDKSGLKIVLNFAKDRPMDAVAVLVITTMNQSSLPVTNVQFEASVSKVSKHCQFKLMENLEL